VTLTFCRDAAAADWIVQSDLPWDRLVTFGPAGFDSYARLRFLPDPVRPGQRENDAEHDGRADQHPTLVEVLATQTATPDDCYFCVWDGFGTAGPGTQARATSFDAGPGNRARTRYCSDAGSPSAMVPRADARPGYAPWPPEAAPPTPPPPKVVVPHRAFWLFRGPLADLGAWDTAQDWPTDYRLHGAEPAFIWPADHAWCVAHDVDPHWAGIGGTRSLINRLTADPRLDVVRADPAGDQPTYS
jgi:hypothetical protein